jgi:hypothetical protein
MDNFQQSALKTSLPSLRNRETTLRGLSGEPELGAASTRMNAMASEMLPLRSSFMRTAAAAEYALDGSVETRE